MLGDLRGTKTETGLTVRASLHEGVHTTGESVSDADMATLNLERHAVCPPGTTPRGHDQPPCPTRLPLSGVGNLLFDDLLYRSRVALSYNSSSTVA